MQTDHVTTEIELDVAVLREHAWQEGRAAALDGDTVDDDPYGRFNMLKSRLWLMGFSSAQAENN